MPRLAANLSMMYNERAFLDRFAAAASDGFRGVEFLFPYEYPAEVGAANLTVRMGLYHCQIVEGDLGGARLGETVAESIGRRT